MRGRAYLLVVRCPAAHSILAGVLQSPAADLLLTDPGEGSGARRAEQEMRARMLRQIEQGELSARCPECGAPFATWQLDFHVTNYGTAEEVEDAIKQAGCTSNEIREFSQPSTDSCEQSGEQGTLFDTNPEAF